jgi:predicted MPP superfamily phosphohydrolase
VHNGQVAPANLIVRQMNRLAYGYEQIGNGHFFVTSGFGFWGRAVFAWVRKRKWW